MDARTEYKKFWDCFHEVWLKNGGESLFTYAQKDFWAVLDSNEPTRARRISLSISGTEVNISD